jgi:hypothetical protein
MNKYFEMIWAWMRYAWSSFRLKFLLLPEAIIVNLFFTPAIVIAFAYRLKFEEGYLTDLRERIKAGAPINFVNDGYFYDKELKGYSARVKQIAWTFWLIILFIYVIV